MLAMSLTGVALSLVRGVPANAIGGLLAIYLVSTARTTVRPPTDAWRWVESAAMLVALATGLASALLGVELLVSGQRARDGVPPPMFFLFGAVGLAAGLSDLRWMRAGSIPGARRLARHLWRMCFALFIATGSFFLGQAKVIPAPFRILPLLVALALAPLLVLPYWLWRVRVRRPWKNP
jgi:hypothetical protein